MAQRFRQGEDGRLVSEMIQDLESVYDEFCLSSRKWVVLGRESRISRALSSPYSSKVACLEDLFHDIAKLSVLSGALAVNEHVKTFFPSIIAVNASIQTAHQTLRAAKQRIERARNSDDPQGDFDPAALHQTNELDIALSTAGSMIEEAHRLTKTLISELNSFRAGRLGAA